MPLMVTRRTISMRIMLLMTIAMRIRATLFSKVLVTTMTMVVTAMCVVPNALRCPESFEDSGIFGYAATTQNPAERP